MSGEPAEGSGKVRAHGGRVTPGTVSPSGGQKQGSTYDLQGGCARETPYPTPDLFHLPATDHHEGL